MMAVSRQRVQSPDPLVYEEQKHNLRILIGALGAVVLLVALATLGRVLSDTHAFPIENVSIRGELQYVVRDGVMQTVGPYLDASFFTVDLSAIQIAVAQLPWVNQVSARRIWPSGLVLNIDEHEPYARWNETEMISAEGARFPVPQLEGNAQQKTAWTKHFHSLPHFSGSAQRYQTLKKQYETAARSLQPLGLSITALHEDGRRSVNLRLSNNVELRLGRRDHMERLSRFVKVYQRHLSPVMGKVRYVDLRYTNGLALGHGVADGKAKR
ncbi:MAG: cell division protein FtsQ/DivIB [Gammaproteobacteria bacterium]|nr:cell division protein FtsQ/DivIB [Gammaproteobacteria bacterium]